MFQTLIKEGVSTMNIKFSKAFLMSGKDYELTPFITLCHPTIGEVLAINKSPFPDNLYWTYIQILLADPYLNMVMSDDMGKNYMETSPYEVFIIQWDNCLKDYQKNRSMYDAYGISPLDNIIQAVSFFMKEKHPFIKGVNDDGSVYFYDPDNPSFCITKKIFECIYEWVKSINNIDYSDRIKPADESARRVLIEDMRNELKKRNRRKKKSDDNSDFLGNIMSAVSFCGNGSITPFNINDCKLYWLNESLSINNKKNHADHILDGIYHGTINSKDINKNELDWIK